MSNNYAVAQSITSDRTILIQMGIVDSFGEFHPDPDQTTEIQDPLWLTMSYEDFVEAATLDMQLSRQKMEQALGK